MADATQPIVDFLTRFLEALGIHATVDVEETDDGPRLNIAGEEAKLLVRHRGEPLKALQHVVDLAFGRMFDGDSSTSAGPGRASSRSHRRVFVDALGYRNGKDL